MNKNTKLILMITLGAISAALYVVLDQLLIISIGNLKITLNALPLIIITLLYGTKVGLLTAIVGTFLSQLFGFGFAPLMVLWMLPEIIRVLIIGLINKNYENKKLLLIITIIISSLIVTILNTGVIAVDALIYNYYSKAYVFGQLVYRIIAGIISGIVYAIICPLIVKQLKPIKYNNKNINKTGENKNE